MKFREVFGDAEWISSSDRRICPLIRKSFSVRDIKSAIIDIIGFSSFVFYINGVRASRDYFLPLATDFEDRGVPSGEKTRHRVYVSRYDIRDLLKNGKNTLAVILSDGWYTGHTGKYKEVPYGEKKLCFKITVEDAEGERFIYSGRDARWSESFVKESDLNFGERHDYRGYSEDMLLPEYDDIGWENAVLMSGADTEYMYTDCPPDRVIEEIKPTLIKSEGNTHIYDAGVNLTGFPSVTTDGFVGTLKIRYSESLDELGELKAKNMHGQYTDYTLCGGRHILEPKFTWLGFRYFSVEGDLIDVSVKRVHADVSVSSDFECDNESLKWLYRAFINTQLCNMHQGIPSDCPHIERRGYVGDGHLAGVGAMLMLDSESFYRKWIDDILDAQDSISGHVQYTAPYTHSGGGPGGFASGFVKIPYIFYKRFGDRELLRRAYEPMLRYFDYLEAHSEFDLVVSDKEGEWCLGEWCVPADKPGDTPIPPPYVNTCYYVKALAMAAEIATIIGKEEDIGWINERIERKKAAIRAAYFNPNSGSFFACANGADAFALDIGLGDERTYDELIAHYESLGAYDTGIFGTDILTGLLFRRGRGDLAVRLMSADSPRGFGEWKRLGATTLWEYWKNPRSMSHPMFGSVSSYLFTEILGIKQQPGDTGYNRFVVSPDLRTGLNRASGYITVNGGRLSVCYEKSGGEISVSVSAPFGSEGIIRVNAPKIPALPSIR